MSKVLFTCEFCGQHFKTEKGFIRHHCDKMQRDEDFKSIAGQAALNYYKDWMFLKHHTRQLNPDAFKTSAYFTSFLKFYKFVLQAHIPAVDAYINLMVRKKIDPKFWALPETYKIYLEFITYQLPLSEQAAITVKTILECSDVGEVDPSEIFDILTPNDVIQLLHQRKLSGWLLLKSRKFADFTINHTTKEERFIMQTIIRPDYWKKQYKNNPKEAQRVKEYIKALEI